ncbi:MAG: hypothetical protein KatS3mg091_842 [Patescibacteria group bacterium]|nr:MAG: hypothetical protein KatS3mg090_0893 [Patescibacteria group bacterium]GIW63149.1 MAG: hypothetical protein KatS3mg090_0975 [Patescibacteria group bacterium]GIW63730.1 MAG: hypothetical protein KatS3mg091_532 [Patescibacteria group bacterium]GIW64040.1 MAG: hypothetical protein KatS3mg091_842 [Patescibacteria group bacterium]
MNPKTKVIIAIVIFIFSSFILFFDIFGHSGEWESYDIRTHIFSLSLFYQSIKRGEFFVRWVEGFNNYGYPLGQIAHQVPAYVGGILNFITQDPVISYKILFFLADFATVFTLFLFLNNFFPFNISILSVLFYQFSAYRIFNIYVRSALPEFLSYFFFFLVCLYILKIYKYGLSKKYLVVTSLSFSLLFLTHPFSIVLYQLVFVYIFLYLALNLKLKEKLLFGLAVVIPFVLGLLLSSYYLLPLKLEKKYFYSGTTPASIEKAHFRSVDKILFVEHWSYSAPEGSSVREDFVQIGFWESLVFLSFILFTLYSIFVKSKKRIRHLLLVFFGFLTLFFISPQSMYLYNSIPVLAEIQHPWRLIGIFELFVCFMFATLLFEIRMQKYRVFNIIKALTLIIFISSFLFYRSSQLYVKNVVDNDKSFYEFTEENLHSINMSPVWSGKGEDYPKVNNKLAVIEGSANILFSDVKKFNNHIYKVKVISDKARFVDHTFYFPGWIVYANESPINIEFQDPNYRGLITFILKKGNYDIQVVYQETKVRSMANYISLVSLLFLLGISFFPSKLYRRYFKFIYNRSF